MGLSDMWTRMHNRTPALAAWDSFNLLTVVNLTPSSILLAARAPDLSKVKACPVPHWKYSIEPWRAPHFFMDDLVRVVCLPRYSRLMQQSKTLDQFWTWPTDVRASPEDAILFGLAYITSVGTSWHGSGDIQVTTRDTSYLDTSPVKRAVEDFIRQSPPAWK